MTEQTGESRKKARKSIGLLACSLAMLFALAPARADFRMCNNTSNRVSVALAYTDGQNWTSEGWWNLKPSDCDVLLRGTLAAEFYYVYAMDERGGEWKGKAYMCAATIVPAFSRSIRARTRATGRCSLPIQRRRDFVKLRADGAISSSDAPRNVEGQRR